MGYIEDLTFFFEFPNMVGSENQETRACKMEIPLRNDLFQSRDELQAGFE